MANSINHSESPGFFNLSLPTIRSWLGNLGWPILLKELRADFRKHRFFVSHFLCILAIALGILVQVWIKGQAGGETMTSVQLGRQLFDTFFILQFLVVLIVFPSFTSTAFTEERANKSLDLLMTTDLKPGEVVLGKFLATSAYCLVTIISTVPLLAISTLFGGVTMEEVFIAYAILIGHTLLVSMLGVFFSSCFTANLRSTLTVYTLVFGYFALLPFVCPESVIVKIPWLGKLISGAQEAPDITIIGLLINGGGTGSRGLEGLRILSGLILYISFLFAFLFVLTTNRIRASTDDKSSHLRILVTLVLFLVLLGISLQPPPSIAGQFEALVAIEDIIAANVWTALILLFVATLVFATEPVALSRRIQRRFSRPRGPLVFFRLFCPGSFWGLGFIAVLLILSTGVLLFHLGEAISWMTAARGDSPEAVQWYQWTQMMTRWREIILTFPIYIFAFGALGFYLSSAGFSRGYCFLTVFFIFIITLLLPVIFRFQKWPDSVFSLYYLSPFTLWESLNQDAIVDPEEPKFLLFGGMPIIEFAKFFFAALAGVFIALGIYLSRSKKISLLLGRS